MMVVIVLNQTVLYIYIYSMMVIIALNQTVLIFAMVVISLSQTRHHGCYNLEPNCVNIYHYGCYSFDPKCINIAAVNIVGIIYYNFI